MVTAEKRIGVLGGTFEPIHMAHLVIAQAALDEGHVDKVLFVPAGLPWMKSRRKISPVAARVRMVELALHGNPGFEISLVDVRRKGPSYTVETLEELKKKYPHGTRFYLIVGADSVREMPQWYQSKKLIRLCRILAFRRPGYNELELGWVESELPGILKSIKWLKAPIMDISATELRRRATRGGSLRYLVPEAVREYIEKEGIYR